VLDHRQTGGAVVSGLPLIEQHLVAIASKLARAKARQRTGSRSGLL
jgi:hypothetical protein